MVRQNTMATVYTFFAQLSMLYRFLMTQMRNKNPKDWISMVLEDLNDLNMSVNLEDIKQMKKLNEKLNIVIKECAQKELTKKKENHSKVKLSNI